MTGVACDCLAPAASARTTAHIATAASEATAAEAPVDAAASVVVARSVAEATVATVAGSSTHRNRGTHRPRRNNLDACRPAGSSTSTRWRTASAGCGRRGALGLAYFYYTCAHTAGARKDRDVQVCKQSEGGTSRKTSPVCNCPRFQGETHRDVAPTSPYRFPWEATEPLAPERLVVRTRVLQSLSVTRVTLNIFGAHHRDARRRGDGGAAVSSRSRGHPTGC